jgi:UDP-glucose 4-epimerase
VRYLITGGSGYIGSRLVDGLVDSEKTDHVVIADVRPPAAFRPKTEFRKLDVRDRAGARELLAAERPDALVHLAFHLDSIHDEAAMYDVDVNGTQNILDAASAAGVQQVLVTSSTTAYGAFPDNPVPLTEDDPVRGSPSFPYARHKAEADRLCQLWAAQHPERVMTIVRPCIVFGPRVDNSLVRLWLKAPFAADVGLPDPPIQFVHEDDVMDALVALLEGAHAGAYNVVGDGMMSVRECGEMIGLRRRRVPLALFRGFADLMWRLRLAEAPGGSVDFSIYPWVTSNQRLKDATGWQPKWTSRDTFESTMRAKGKLPDGA